MYPTRAPSPKAVIGRGFRYGWRRLPDSAKSSRLAWELGSFIYRRHTRHTNRYQSHSTHFLRNIPQLEVLRELLAAKRWDRPVRLASIGCSTGAELYSALWIIRSKRPDLEIEARGIDISDGVVDVAREGVYRADEAAAEGSLYTAGYPELYSSEIESLRGILERRVDGAYRVRDWLRRNVSWDICDATSDELPRIAGRRDAVMANNFLGPMDDDLAAACLRNIARIVEPGGLLIVDGVDLDVKQSVMMGTNADPVLDRIDEIHTADPTKDDWPWTRWSHEPLNRRLPGWEYRYSTIFRIPRALSS